MAQENSSAGGEAVKRASNSSKACQHVKVTQQSALDGIGKLFGWYGGKGFFLGVRGGHTLGRENYMREEEALGCSSAGRAAEESSRPHTL